MFIIRLTTIIITLIVLTVNPAQLVKSECLNKCLNSKQAAHSCCKGERSCCQNSNTVEPVTRIGQCGCASQPHSAVITSLSLKLAEEQVVKIVLSSMNPLINVIASSLSCTEVLEMAQWRPPKADLYLLNRVLRI